MMEEVEDEDDVTTGKQLQGERPELRPTRDEGGEAVSGKETIAGQTEGAGHGPDAEGDRRSRY